MTNDKLIVVTGAAGFIGSAVIAHLNEKGIDQIVAVDELGLDKRWKNLVGKGVSEVLHKDQLFPWLEERSTDVGAVIHLGACSDTTESNADFLLANNTHYSQALADFSLEQGWRFIYASSAATYGDGSLGFVDNEDELEQLRPLNMYGFSKQLFDLWLKKQGFLNRVVGLKYFNVFGPNEYHKGAMASHIVKMVEQVKDGKVRLFKSNDPQYKDGDQQRDFIYVKDVAAMTCSFLDNDLGGIYNVGRGEPVTWNALAKATMKALGKEVPIEYFEMPEKLIGQYQNYTCASMNKWKESGLAMPKYSLEGSVKEYVQEYLEKGAYW